MSSSAATTGKILNGGEEVSVSVMGTSCLGVSFWTESKIRRSSAHGFQLLVENGPGESLEVTYGSPRNVKDCYGVQKNSDQPGT